MEKPIRTYEELLRITKEKIDEEKNKIVLPSRNEMNVPPHMSAEDFQGMGLVQGDRVSWETRQEHIVTLAGLFAEGYLTEEEYDKRIAWVQDAQTQQQIDIAFADLQRSLHLMQFRKYAEQRDKNMPRKSSVSKRDWGLLVLTYAVLMFMFIVSVMSGTWFNVGLFLIELMGLSFTFGYRLWRNHHNG